jgi:hypothetical protein
VPKGKAQHAQQSGIEFNIPLEQGKYQAYKMFWPFFMNTFISYGDETCTKTIDKVQRAPNFESWPAMTFISKKHKN